MHFMTRLLISAVSVAMFVTIVCAAYAWQTSEAASTIAILIAGGALWGFAAEWASEKDGAWIGVIWFILVTEYVLGPVSYIAIFGYNSSPTPFVFLLIAFPIIVITSLIITRAVRRLTRPRASA